MVKGKDDSIRKAHRLQTENKLSLLLAVRFVPPMDALYAKLIGAGAANFLGRMGMNEVMQHGTAI